MFEYKLHLMKNELSVSAHIQYVKIYFIEGN